MRVVIDTNIIISGFFFGGIPREVLNLGAEGKFAFCFTTVTFAELEKIIWSAKFIQQRALLSIPPQYLLKELRERSLFFPQAEKVPQWIKNNKADNYILACALVCGADFIVSGDKHLLNLERFQNIPILAPREFINCFEKLK